MKQLTRWMLSEAATAWIVSEQEGRSALRDLTDYARSIHGDDDAVGLLSEAECIMGRVEERVSEMRDSSSESRSYWVYKAIDSWVEEERELDPMQVRTFLALVTAILNRLRDRSMREKLVECRNRLQTMAA